VGSCSLLFDALRSSSRAGAIRLQRKTWPLRSGSKLSEGLGAASAGGEPDMQISRIRLSDKTSRAVKFSGGSKRKAPPSLPLVDPPFIGKSTSYPCPRRTCCFAPNTCSRCLLAGVHPGLPGIGKSEHDGGTVRVRSREVSKAKRHRLYPW
jgi:hypothetical protein